MKSSLRLRSILILMSFSLYVPNFVSFVVALIVVGKFLSFLAKHSLKAFAYYRIIVGGIMLVLVVLGVVK